MAISSRCRMTRTQGHQWGMSPWWLFLVLLFWCPIFKSQQPTCIFNLAAKILPNADKKEKHLYLQSHNVATFVNMITRWIHPAKCNHMDLIWSLVWYCIIIGNDIQMICLYPISKRCMYSHMGNFIFFLNGYLLMSMIYGSEMYRCNPPLNLEMICACLRNQKQFIGVIKQMCLNCSCL